MYPGYSTEKRAAYRAKLKAAGLTHIPFAAWGAYGSDPAFDFRDNPSGFRDLIDEAQSDGLVVMLMAITDGLPGDDGYTEDDAHNFIRGWRSQFKDIVRFVVTGWEFSQINSGFGDETANGSTTGNLPSSTPTTATATATKAVGMTTFGIETEDERAHHIRMRLLRRQLEARRGAAPSSAASSSAASSSAASSSAASSSAASSSAPTATPTGSYTPLPAHSSRLYWTWSGDAHLRIAQTLREVFGAEGDAIVYCHFHLNGLPAGPTITRLLRSARRTGLVEGRRRPRDGRHPLSAAVAGGGQVHDWRIRPAAPTKKAATILATPSGLRTHGRSTGRWPRLSSRATWNDPTASRRSSIRIRA